MSSFGAKGLTNKGRVLQAKAQAGAQLQYTKYVLGDGQLGGQSIATLTNVISPKKSADVTRLWMHPPNEAIVGFVLSNQDVTTGFYFRELGLYAMDPDEGEILYWYGNAGDTADYIPPTSTGDVVSKTIDIYVYVGTASNVTLTVDQNLAYVTHDELEAALEGLDPDIPTASTTQPGIVQLSSATDSTSEAMAATPKAVKAAYDKADSAQLNLNKHSADSTAHVRYAADTGTENAKVVTLDPPPTSYVEGMAVAFKNKILNTGPVTIDVNGLGAKPILKANGNALSSGNLKANSIYTLRYNGTSFILQGEGGGGNAKPEHVLAPHTFTNDDGEAVGTMVDRGAVTIIPGNSDQNIPAGYHNGLGVVKAMNAPEATSETISIPANSRYDVIPPQGKKLVALGFENKESSIKNIMYGFADIGVRGNTAYPDGVYLESITNSKASLYNPVGWVSTIDAYKAVV